MSRWLRGMALGFALLTAVGAGVGFGFIVASWSDAVGVWIGSIVGVAALVAALGWGYRCTWSRTPEEIRTHPLARANTRS